MLFIARRYLLSKRSRSVVNIIAGVSLVSVAIPVAAIITLLSIFNGFGSLVEGMNEATDGDITLQVVKGRYFDSRSIDTAQLRAIEGVEYLSEVCQQTIIVEHKGREAVVSLRGVDSNFADVVPIEGYMRMGNFALEWGDIDRIAIGATLATTLGVRGINGVKLGLYSPHSSRLQALSPMMGAKVDSAALAGIYILDVQSEERIMYAPLRLAQRLLGGHKNLSSIVIKVGKGHERQRVRSQIERVVGSEYSVKLREEMNPMLYDIIRYERWGILLISTMVMLLASLSLIGVVAMLITEKREDMTTLRVMGATRQNLRAIFFLQGMILSKVGVLAGAIVGVCVTLAQQYLGIVKLPLGVFVVEAYPVVLRCADVALVVVIAVSIAAMLNYIVTLKMIK